MCDYSLHAVASRPAKVGERLVSTKFPLTVTRGFCGEDDPNVAVCVLPGTELAFDREVDYDGAFFRKKIRHTVARFRTVDLDNPNRHHDALEFPDGQLVLLTQLDPGQRATVLQLPAMPLRPRTEADAAEAAPSHVEIR
ncbi:MAG: hypothetical protein E6Q28_06565 [Afipia sp.]|nr:MAG: hypothetical protein E6Q28_06565 [Afipia sp.]